MKVGVVCEKCEGFNELDVERCSSCGVLLSENISCVSDRLEEKYMVAPTGGKKCSNCGLDIPQGFKFCGGCGTKIEEFDAGAAQSGQGQEPAAKTLFFGAMQAPGRAKLILIKSQGQDGMTYYLSSTEHIAGRDGGDIPFPEPDPLLSPTHANFYYEEGTLFVRDEESANGVFIRITDSVPINSGDTFLVGEQLMRIEKTRDDEAPSVDGEGTYFYSSPSYPSAFQAVQILHGGSIGTVFRAHGDKLTIGREGNDLNFPDDPFISGHHAHVSVASEDTDSDFLLTDMGSKNGTFFRLSETRKLGHGDYVFIGQQLLRVEII